MSVMNRPIRLTRTIRIKDPRLLALGVAVAMVFAGATTYLVFRTDRDAALLVRGAQGEEGAEEPQVQGAGQSEQEVQTAAPEVMTSGASAEAGEAGEAGEAEKAGEAGEADKTEKADKTALAQQQAEKEEQAVTTAGLDPREDPPEVPAEAPPVNKAATAPARKPNMVERVVLAVEASTGKGPDTAGGEASASQGTPADGAGVPSKDQPRPATRAPSPPPLSPQLAQMVNEQRNLRIERLREMLRKGK